jgi:hypothetical protein
MGLLFVIVQYVLHHDYKHHQQTMIAMIAMAANGQNAMVDWYQWLTPTLT